MQIMDYINTHRMDENPCECVILPDGSVEEPTPSHIEKLAEINKKMDKNMEPLLFMVEYTGCMLVWQTRVVVPSSPTAKQEEALETLYFAAMLSPNYLREQVGENYVECVKRSRNEQK